MTTIHPIISPKKLIEVALPLDAINEASQAEKRNPFLKAHPRSFHQYWARRPHTAARAVLFAQLVNDPSWKWEIEHTGDTPPGHLKASWAASRKRIFSILEDLVKWENTNNEAVLQKARAEIVRSWRETCDVNGDHPSASEIFNADVIPCLHDPFAGGGTIPLEAQRLGIEAYASDLNPVAVVINKAMIEIPSLFAAQPPVNSTKRARRTLVAEEWQGSKGLAEDVLHYGKWIRDEAEKRIGGLYPDVEVTEEESKSRPDLKPYVGNKLPVIAWIWARTVRSPNPAFTHCKVPLASTFLLSSKDGKEAFIEPIIDGDKYRFMVRTGKASNQTATNSGTKISRGANFRCLLSGTAIEGDFIKAEGKAGRLGFKLMAIVAEGIGGRVYLSPTEDMEAIARNVNPTWQPETPLPDDARNFWTINYGLTHFHHLFSARQLVALTTLSELISEVHGRVVKDALAVGITTRTEQSSCNQLRAEDYADAIAVYLALATSRWTDNSNAIASWNSINQNIRVCFTRQAIPMSWDFAELSPFTNMGGWFTTVTNAAAIIAAMNPVAKGHALQDNARTQCISVGKIVSTDPPYYDNVTYSDLSDFFYVWLRRTLSPILPSLFATITAPKVEELIAAPYRHGGKEAAELFFLNGMTEAMHRLSEQAHPGYPVTIYYAFKQSETESEGTASTGWQTFLEAVLKAGFAIVGTWPIQTEKTTGTKTGVNALASSVVLVCRHRPLDAESISRREFIRELDRVLPDALDEMTKGSGYDHSPVAPVDLSQAIIGPGMAVFSEYAAVLEADGSAMSVRTALQLINRFLAEDDFDADTQFCLHWFEQYGWETGKFGEADVLARSKGTSVDGIKQAGVLDSAAGNVRLLKWAEYPTDWDPQTDQRLPVWEVLHQLIRVFSTDGETGAASVFAAVQSKAEAARQLAYRLYTLCERKGWAEDARAYNEVVTSWSGIESTAAKEPAASQRTMFDN